MERSLSQSRPATGKIRWYSWLLGCLWRGGLARERRQLARLEPHLLRDIGLSAEVAQQEAARPRWDAPAHWVRRDLP